MSTLKRAGRLSPVVAAWRPRILDSTSGSTRRRATDVEGRGHRCYARSALTSAVTETAEQAHEACSGRPAKKHPFPPPCSQEHDFWQVFCMNAPLPEAVRRALAEVTLDDKWTLDRGRAYMSGTQALIRLMMLQHQRDQLARLTTAGFINGYRGSPLGGVDQTAVRAKKHLERHNIRFQPGVNEDLAATAVWGTQQVNMYEGAKYDGVFAMWYGKGPGVDRCGDVFKHANA